MQGIKDVLLGMMVQMMPLFSPALIFSMVMLAVAGFIVLMVNKETSVQKIIRLVIWVVGVALLFLFILDPIIAVLKSEKNTYSIVNPFTQLANFKGKMSNPLGLVLSVVPYILILLALVTLIFRTGAGALGIGRFWLVMGIVFIACQVMGQWLGLSASVNFGDLNNFEFITVPFWILGIGMVVIGSILSISGRIARNRTV